MGRGRQWVWSQKKRDDEPTGMVSKVFSIRKFVMYTSHYIGCGVFTNTCEIDVVQFFINLLPFPIAHTVLTDRHSL